MKDISRAMNGIARPRHPRTATVGVGCIMTVVGDHELDGT